MQQCSESIRSYIQWWSIIKNSIVDVSNERAIDAFMVGLRRADLVEEMGRIKPKKIVLKLMDIANRFTGGKDACNNKRTRSPKDDRGNRYSNQRQKSRNYDNYGSHSQVAVGYKENAYQGDDHKNSRYHNNSREDSSSNKQFQPRGSREYNESPNDMLNGLCHIHYAFIDDKSVTACNEGLQDIFETARSSRK
jgi:hypothetical protein